MPRSTRYVTNDQLTTIGRRYNCDEVGLEASEAAARWRRDLDALSGYGYGQTALAAFEADVTTHAGLRSSRPEAVAEKRSAVVLREQEVSRAWAWVDRVKSVLGVLARTDQGVATQLEAATPLDDAALDAGIRALAALLLESKAALAPETKVDARLAEVDEVCAALRAQPGKVQTSKSQTVADTAQIDLFDGKRTCACAT
jgi:hypothetical protein